MRSWISKTPRRKNEVFICPYCRNEVRYTDGEARKKGSKKVTECGYIFCPYCREQLKERKEC